MPRPIHFEILAENPERAVAFCREALGWEISTWGSAQAYWLVTTGPDTARGINGAIMGRELPQAVINTMEVESLEAALKRVEVAGGKKVHGPSEVPGVGMHAYCADPEGNLFGILQPLPREGG
jgi:predicted enzyme related to lactoylglutathione lyase